VADVENFHYPLHLRVAAVEQVSEVFAFGGGRRAVGVSRREWMAALTPFYQLRTASDC